MNKNVIRLIDLTAATLGLLVFLPVLLLLLVIGLFDTGSPLFIQERVGKHQKLFRLIKLRTMKKSTPSVASHLASTAAITSFGKFLRKSKLDELPQLWNVITGEMSLVGPRPCLPNQTELVNRRAEAGMFKMKPGITGLAQIQNIDMSNPEKLVSTEVIMMQDFSIRNYFKYILRTFGGSGRGDAIK